MAIDLNGSSVAGQSYVTSYREDDPAIGIVASDVQVGTGSATYNTDNIRCIRIRLEQPHAEDTWQIATLPLGIEVRLAYDSSALALPAALSALIAPSLYLRSLHPVSDVDWQNALKAISFFADEAHAPTRTIEITAQNNNNAWQPPVATEINIIANNDAPVTFADTGEAVEAGGVNNTLPGSNATGNVLSNDVDFDGPSHDMVVSAVAFGESTASPGTSIQGAYGTLTIQADGYYTYVVNEDNPVVQSLRSEHFSVTDTFGYTATDAGGASSSSTLSITIKGQDDTPFDIAVGHRFDGTAASVVASSTALDVGRYFTFELRVSPTHSITLHPQNLSGAAGTTGQEYAVTPLPGWTLGGTGHAGVGLSVGINGVAVYQHAENLLSPLLTWSGSLSANTHVAVVFHDNQPHLYVNGALMAVGLQSDKPLHPPTELGGNTWGYFDGSISDFIVWHGAFSPEDVAVRALDSSLPDDATPALALLQVRVPENVAEGTVVTTVRARDVDNSDPLTYSLISDAQGRFQIDSVTGEVRVAPGALFDHEAAHEITLTARVTDLAGQSALHNFTVTIGDINEAPLLANDASNASAGFVSLMVDQDHGLWWLDATGGQRSFIATASAPITALASTSEGFHFAVSADTLYRLDPATGHCLAIGPLSVSGSLQMTGLTSTPDGALFGVNTAGDLYLISSQSGSAQRIVTLNSGVSSNGDVAYANGALYWTTASGNLMRYEPATNQHGVAMSGLPSHGGLGSLDSLMAVDDDTLYAVDDIAGRTYRINLVDLTFTPVDTLLPLHTAGQTFRDGAEIRSLGNIFANDPALEANDYHLVTEVISESDDGNAGPAGTTINGAYGTLLLQAEGHYVYSVDAGNAAVMGLRGPGDTLVDRFLYKVADAAGLITTAELVVTVRGFNHVPEVNSHLVMAVEAGGVHNGTPGLNPTGNVLEHDWDADGDSLRVHQVVYHGAPVNLGSPLALDYGVFRLDADGTYSYMLNQNNPTVEALRTSADTLTETITYQVIDARGAARTAHLVIHIEGRDDAPVARAVVATAIEAGGVHNTTAGLNPTGQVIHNGIDVDDAPANVRVVRAQTQVNLIRNGSFEQAPGTADGSLLTSAMPYWTNAGATNIKFFRDDTANDGRVSVDLDAWTALDSLRQSNIATQAGKTYELQFDLSPRAGYSGTTVEVYWNEQLMGLAQVDGSGWTTATFQVTGSGNDTLRLAELASENDTGGPRIDNVRLYQTGVDQALQGQYGTLTLNEDGSYQYNVDQSNAQVQALRLHQDTLQETFTYTLVDQAGLTSTSTLTVTVHGKNDAPESIVLGRIFNGDSASVITGTPLPDSRSFSFELNVSPLESIALRAQSLTGVAGTSGQRYALSPIQSELFWGGKQHVGVGLSVGTNGISVYQHTGDLLSPLLTWSGTVGANTHVAVNVIDNRPSLYVNGQLVATGLQSDKLLHPPTEVGGIHWGYFKGSISDVQVWDGALTWNNGVATPAGSTPLFRAATLEVNENSAPGTVVTGLRSSDVDAGDTLTYSLLEDGGGRFVVNATTGEVLVAPGAVLDHEALGSLTLRARVTDAEGLFQEISFVVTVADVNEAPGSANAEAVMNEDNQIRVDASRVDDIVVGGVSVPAVRIDSLPPGGSLLLDNELVVVGQVIAANDASRLLFKPDLFSEAAFGFTDPDSGDRVHAIRIVALPDAAHGQLLFDGQPIGADTSVVLVSELAKLSFEPARDYNGEASFTYRAIDGRGTTQSGAASTFTIHVQAVNDTPVVAPVINIDVHEGTTTVLKGLGFDDVDANNGEMVVRLKVDEGVLRATANPDVSIEGSGTDTLVLRGTLQALNALVVGSPGVSYEAPYREPPAITTTVANIDTDPQASDPLARVIVHTAGGTLTATAREGVTLAGSGTDTITLEGRSSVLHTYVNDEKGVQRLVPNATAHLHILLDDQGATGADPGLSGSDTNEQDVRVVALNIVSQGLPLSDPPTLPAQGPGGSTAGSIDATTVAGVAVGTTLVIGVGLFDQLRRRIGGRGGAEAIVDNAYELMISDQADAARRAEADAAFEASSTVEFALSGETLAYIVGGLVTGGGAATVVTVVVQNAHAPQGGGSTTPQVNQTPHVTGPDSLNGLEDSSIRISGLNFSDSDAGDGSVRVTFEIPQGAGVLQAQAADGVQILAGSARSLALVGTVTAINAFVSGEPGVRFVPAAHANGQFDLTVTINDLGNTGTDPGLSGDANSEESSLLIHLNVAPVSDAPSGQDGTVVVDSQASLVISETMLGFFDIDNHAFTGIQITELPTHGQLLHEGQPVLVGDLISTLDLNDNKLVFVPDPALSGDPQSPRMGFLVRDNGPTDNGGLNIAAHPSYLTFHVEYPPTLEVEFPTSTFHEAQGQPLNFLMEATLADRNHPAQAIRTVWVQATDLAYGDEWGIDAALLASFTGDAQPFETTGHDNGLRSYTFADGASPAFVQALLEAVVFKVQAPNATEGTRHFTVTVEDVDGRSSAPVAVEIAVVSVLGEALRAIDSAQDKLVESFQHAATGAGALSLRGDVLAWFEARVALAEATWNTLALAPLQDGVHNFGPSIREALSALTLDVSDLAAALGQDVRFPSLTPWLQTTGDGSRVDVRPADMPEWLGRVAQAQIQGIQAIYAELKAMTRPIGTHSAAGDEETVTAFDLGLANALIPGLSRLGIEPIVTPVPGDPATALAQSGAAWVQTEDGHVWLRPDQHRQLALQMEAARLDQFNGAIKPIERIVLTLLGSSPGEDGLLRSDPQLLDLLHMLGVSTDEVITLLPTDDPVALLMQPGSVGLNGESMLLMSPVTQKLLMQSLTDVAKAEVSVTSPLQHLHRHLGTLVATDGVVTIDADTALSIARSELALRLSGEPGDITRFGTAVVHPTNGTWQITLATLAGWQQQLQVMSGMASPVAPHTIAHGDALHLQAQLEAPAQDSLYGKPFVRLNMSPLLGSLLAAHDIDIHQAQGYSSAERDLLVAPRVSSEPRLALSLEVGHVLVPAAVALQLGHVLGRSVHDTGLRLVDTPPSVEPGISNTTDSLAQQLSQTLHAQTMDHLLKQTDRLPTGDVMLLWKAVAQVLAPALGLTTEVPISAGSAPAVPGVTLDISARRWVTELREFGLDVRLVDASDVASANDVGTWHVAADDHGRVLMTSSAHATLTQTLLIQNHASRAALAEGLLDLLTRTDVQHVMALIDNNGQLRTLTAAGAAQMGLALVPLAVVEALAALGIALPTTLSRSSTPSELNDVARLGTDPDTMLVDPQRSLVLLSHDTLLRLAHDAVLTRIGADEARYTLEPESVTQGSTPLDLALNTTGMAHAMQALDQATLQADGLVRVGTTATLLLQAGLGVNEVVGTAQGWRDRLQAATMSVLADPALPGTLLMSQATLDHLVLLANLNMEGLAAVQNGTPVPSAGDLAAAWLLHETVDDGITINPEGTVLIEHAADLFTLLTHFGIAHTVVGQVEDGFSDALDALTRTTPHGVVTVLGSTDVRVSRSTWQEWMTAAEQAVRSQGGAAFLDRWTPDRTQAPQAATDWRATTEEVASHDALIDFINAASLHASFKPGAQGGSWSWPANGPTSSLTAWQTWIGSEFTLVDVGVIDPFSSAGQDALNSAPYAVGHDATGRLWANDHMHRIMQTTLAGRLAESSETLRTQALQSLVSNPVMDGVARWSDATVVQALQRLGLLDADTLRLHDLPGAPSLTFVDATTVALDAATRDAVIVRLGEMAVLANDSVRTNVLSWLDAVNAALQTLDAAQGPLISVSASGHLLMNAGLVGFTQKPCPADDLAARSQAVVGTILVGEDGTLRMQAQTLLMLHAQLKGLAHARTLFEVSDAVQFPALAQVLTALSLAAEQPADLSASFANADLDWSQSLAPWRALPQQALQTLHELLGLDPLLFLQNQGVPLEVVDHSMLIEAAQAGLIHRPFTVITDLQGQVLMSPQTLKQIGHHLVTQLKQSTGLDWAEVFDTRSGTSNALASLFGTGDHGSGADKRALMQNTTVNHEQARQDTIDVINQLLRSEPASADNSALVLLGDNFTPADLNKLMLRLAEYGLPHTVVELVSTTNGTVLDGQYAVEGSRLLATRDTALDLLEAADLLLHTVAIGQQRELIDQLTEQTYAGAVNLPFVQLANTTALMNALSLRQTSAVTVKDVNGTLHSVAFEELIHARPDPERSLNATVSLKNLQGHTFNANATETDAAWQRLADGKAYGVKANGDPFVSMALRNELLEQALSGTSASAGVVARHLLKGLNNATLDNGMQVVEIHGLTSLLQELGIATLVANNSDGLRVSGAILALGDNRFGMSNSTLEQLHNNVEQRSVHSASLNQQLLARLGDAQAIYNASDWLASQSQTHLDGRWARSDGVDQGKLVIHVTLSNGIVLAMQQAQVLDATQDPMGTSQSDYDALYAAGEVRRGTSTVGGSQVLVMTTETWAQVRAQWDAAQPAPGQGVVLMENADVVALLEKAGITPITVTQLRVDGTPTTHFDTLSQFSKALHEAPKGALFIDAQQRVWMTVDTHRSLELPAQAAANAADWPLLTQDPTSVAADLALFRELMPFFNGNQTAGEPAGGAMGWKGYALDATQVTQLEQLGIPLSASTPALGSLSQLAFAPAYTTQTDDAGQHWIDARTYALVSEQVQGRGHALIASLFQNTWERMNIVDDNGNTQVWWLSTAADGAFFEQSLALTGLSLTHRTDLNPANPVLDLLDGGAAYARDPLGRVFVSDATHAGLTAALERVTLLADSACLTQSFAALKQFAISEGVELVRVTALALQVAIDNHPDIERSTGPVNLLNLTAQQLRLLQDSGTVNVLDDGQGNYYLTRSAANRLAGAVANALPELKDAESALPAGPTVVQVRGAQALDYLEDRLDMSLKPLTDEHGQAVNTANVSAASLTHTQREWLDNQPGTVVLDKDGCLLMSAQTFDSLLAQAGQQLARTDEQIAERLTEALAAADAVQVPTGNGALTDAVITLVGQANVWTDLLREMQLPLEMRLLSTTDEGSTDYSPLFAVTSPILGVDPQGQLVMQASLRESLLPAIAAIGMRTHAIASGRLILAEGAETVDADALPHPSSAYYESSAATAGWSRWYGVATGARAYLSADMYIDNKYGAKYQELMTQALSNTPAMIDLIAHGVKVPHAYMLMAYLEDPVGSPRTLAPYVIDSDGFEMADFTRDLDSLEKITVIERNIAPKNIYSNWQQDVRQGINDVTDSFVRYRDAAQNLITAFENNQATPMLHGFYDAALDAFEFQADNFINQLKVYVAPFGLAGMTEYLSGNEILDVKIHVDRSFNDIAKLERENLRSVDVLAESYNTLHDQFKALQRLSNKFEANLNDIFDSPTQAREKIKSDLLAAIKDDKEINDQVFMAQKALQQQRFVASLGRLVFQVESQLVDSVLQVKKANSLLGDSPEAVNLSRQYLAAAGATGFAAAAGFFSALQVPVALYRTQVDKFSDWNWSVFKEYFTKTNILQSAFVGPGILWNHGTDLPLRHTIKEQLYQKIREGIILSSETNKATGSTYFLANSFGILGGAAQTVQGFFTPSHLGNYLITRGVVSSLAGVPSLLADLYGALSKDPALLNQGAYLNAVGHVLLQMALPLMDAIAYPVMHFGLQDANVSLGTAVNSLLSASLYGLGLGVISANWPMALSLMVLANVDFSAVLAAVAEGASYQALTAQDRTVEAAVANQLWWDDVFKAIPLIGNGVWLRTAYEAHNGTATELTRKQYQQAVSERVQALENTDDKLSQNALQVAKNLEAEGQFYLVRGLIDDFPYQINDGIRVIKSVVVNEVSGGVADTVADVKFYDEGVDISGVDNNLRNEAVITVERPNLTGGLATYYIAPETTAQLALITDPVRAANMLIDTRGSSVDSSNRFLVYNARVAILGGAGDDEYLLMQALTPELNSAGKRIVGYINDGWSGTGRDLVNFSYAPNAVGIHTGVSYNGLTAYDGIRQFVGSWQADFITRYASHRSDATVVIAGGQGTAGDLIDLRGGNNLVMLANGVVRLGETGTASVTTNAQSVGFTVNLEDERVKGLWKDDPTGYAKLFDNTFDATNSNVINVMSTRAANASVEIQGHSLAVDTVAFSLLDAGVDLRFDTTDNTYRFASYSQGTTGAGMGFANVHIDKLIGSTHADRIVIESTDNADATLKQIQGNGGDDHIQVNRSGLTIETNDGRSNVVLGSTATGSQVFAGVGTQVVVDTDVATLVDTDKVVVAIDHHLPGVAPEDGTTRVDARTSNVALHVRASAGSLEIDLGTGDATVEIGENVRQVVIRDTSADIGQLQLLFRNADKSFDLVDDLQAVNGTWGHFSRNAINAHVFESVWTSASGRQVDIRIEAADASMDEVFIGGAFAAANTYQQLDQLVA